MQKSTPSSEQLIGAIDQGTTSSRFMIFSLATGELITFYQTPVSRKHPENGWVEQDPEELFQSVLTCINKAVNNLESMGYNKKNIAAVGITNQRETLIVWDRETGNPLYPAIVWLDNRTAKLKEELVQRTRNKSELAFQKTCGLPISTYFSALKLRWLLDEVPAVQEAAKHRTLHIGTVDTWLLWKLTNRRTYATDVTNASRTMLMNLHRLQWDVELCKFFRVDPTLLPTIRSSADNFGEIALEDCALFGLPITGVLGDQQAALVGQDCTRVGLVKNTYGTGCFMLCHTGEEPVFSQHGLLTTVAYQMGPRSPVYYALEGSVAAAGSTMHWLRDNLKFFAKEEDIEPLARLVPDTADCYLVPAFTGLLCPYWRPDARTILTGVTYATQPAHIVRAALEAVCFQTSELLQAMHSDCTQMAMSKAGSSKFTLRHISSGLSGNSFTNMSSDEDNDEEEMNANDDNNHLVATSAASASSSRHHRQQARISGGRVKLSRLRVDGGMVANDLLLQLQADICGVKVERPVLLETTALGAAIAAAHGAGLDPKGMLHRNFDLFQPTIVSAERESRLKRWQSAVQRSLSWVCVDNARSPVEASAGRTATVLSIFGVGTVSFVCGALALFWFSKRFKL